LPVEGGAPKKAASADDALACKWVLWEQVSQSREAGKAAQYYSDVTHKVGGFETAKGFWRYWNHLPQPSELLDGKKFVRQSSEADASPSLVDAMMIFRESVKPEWEDPANEAGGHFQLQLKPNLGGGVIDEYWNNIVLAMVTDSFDVQGKVTGVRLVDKLVSAKTPTIRIEVWFSGIDQTEEVERLQKSLETCMLTKLDGSIGAPQWGRMDVKSHKSHDKTATASSHYKK